ncbi:MAG: hypothetical protein NE328_13635 [Lentisphaeraceae bacterium]|nr:hypothetical protein [Lentisphaeraceae bacterium]
MKTFLALLLLTLSTFAREPIRTIIVSGQSNSDGRAETADIPKDTDLNFDNFYFYHGNASGNAHESCPSNELITLRPGSGSLYEGKNHFGIEIGTAMILREKFPNEKFLIIKYAKGGSSLFTDWDLKKGPHLKKLRETVAGAYKAIRENGYEPDLRVFLWHQGESDSKEDRVGTYKEKLTLFLKQMKKDFSSTMGYAIGQINLAQKIDPKLSGQIMTAQAEVAKSFGKSILVPSEGLSLKDDQMHFNTEGMIALGKRYGSAILPYMSKREVFNVWPQNPPDNWKNNVEETAVRSGGVTRITGVTKPILTFYPVKDKNRPVVLVCPGGGYKKLAYDKEGTELAEWFNSQNINAFVLKYRLPGKGDVRHLPPLQDAQRSISFIRSKAKEYGYNGGSVGMIGFSAGGHLTVMTSTSAKRAYNNIDAIDAFKHRPDFSIPIYPAYLSDKGALTEIIKVDSQTPPTFIMHAEDDRGHFKNSPVYEEALKKAGVSYEFFRCKTGGHGHGMRITSKEADKWPEALAKWLKNNIN